MHEELVKRLREESEYADLVAYMHGIRPIGPEDATEQIARSWRELFTKAADAIEELSKPRWIPTKERLPEMGKEVLVSDKHKGINIAWIVGCFSKDGASFEWACESDGWIDDQLPITHWMPLPAPPKEET